MSTAKTQTLGTYPHSCWAPVLWAEPNNNLLASSGKYR